ncbi:hypothetical protein D9M73_223740 [compost metagenome]
MFDLPALRLSHAIQMYATEGVGNANDRINECCRFAGVDLDIYRVDLGQASKQERLSLHHRLAGKRPQVALMQN